MRNINEVVKEAVTEALARRAGLWLVKCYALWLGARSTASAEGAVDAARKFEAYLTEQPKSP